MNSSLHLCTVNILLGGAQPIVGTIIDKVGLFIITHQLVVDLLISLVFFQTTRTTDQTSKFFPQLLLPRDF
jgi:hypothetical protein